MSSVLCWPPGLERVGAGTDAGKKGGLTWHALTSVLARSTSVGNFNKISELKSEMSDTWFLFLFFEENWQQKQSVYKYFCTCFFVFEEKKQLFVLSIVIWIIVQTYNYKKNTQYNI